MSIHTLSYFPMALQIFHRNPGPEDVQRILAGCRDEIQNLPTTLAGSVRLLGGRETAEVPQIVLQLLVGLTSADVKGVLMQETLLVAAYLRQDIGILEAIQAMYEPVSHEEKRGRGRGRPAKAERTPGEPEPPEAPEGMQ